MKKLRIYGFFLRNFFYFAIHYQLHFIAIVLIRVLSLLFSFLILSLISSLLLCSPIFCFFLVYPLIVSFRLFPSLTFFSILLISLAFVWRRFSSQILSGVDYLHQKGVIHRWEEPYIFFKSREKSIEYDGSYLHDIWLYT